MQSFDPTQKNPEKSRVSVEKERKKFSNYWCFDATRYKKIIEKILDLILDVNFNESASDKFHNNLNSNTELDYHFSGFVMY